ncbi:MAG TPA: hypothetical protein VIF62_30920 [Labilithrix sp.]
MARLGRFGYYDRLSAKEQATYRKSAEIGAIEIPDAPALAPLVKAIDVALASGKRVRVAASTQGFSDALLRQLGAPTLKVRVRETRPQIADGAELHGLYTFRQDGKEPWIEVWMRTAAKGDVVKFRTFLRTFLHEIAHHLDVTILELDDSFHTEGFFRRESSLVRQLLPPRAEKPKREEKLVAVPRAKQLSLFGKG